ncbi:WD40 repeat-like protein [Fomitiporia mediterranea MF3/22]|uniref:WD40 repeat-like protein n=1 Tax=Fomitiporia mediterranea (strain MF3/22) TaxID=694068 RepID=UPI00044076BA|nr:WD40 repeat-like protein [Fomitiporia mediterranea MF3/22]EJD02340.1 WD40 repeat-like protein [Fomitiporia mediterranea MF3/22]
MAHSDSDDDVEVNDAFDFDARSSEADEVNEDDLFDADEASERAEETGSEEEEEDADAEAEAEAEGEEDEEDEDESMDIAAVQKEIVPLQASLQPPPLPGPSIGHVKEQTPELQERPMSPAQARRAKLVPALLNPRSYTVEAICAIAHPEPTHSLAASACMTHLLTGSQDGYVRDYDVFAAVNGKTFLTAPQRAHCGVVEGTMKAGQLRMWWENPAFPTSADSVVEDHSRSPVTSLAMHSDALWALAGTEKGHVNLFTVRHEPGQFITAMDGHRNLVSSLAISHDEMGFFSAGWDGDVYQWDLNTGHQVRKFTSTGAQVAVVAVRPLGPTLPPPTSTSAGGSNNNNARQQQDDDDAKSDGSYDPLFDEPDEDEKDAAVGMTQAKTSGNEQQATSSTTPQAKTPAAAGGATYPRGPPVLDSASYGAFSPDVLLTASVDGSIVLWDRRVNTPGKGVGRLEMSSKTPPWCVSACWSADGGQVYAGRRNCTVDVWDTRQYGQAVNGVPRLMKTLRNPTSSGAVSCVAAFPDGRHIAVASNDNIRLWNASEGGEGTETGGGRGRSGVPFKIIPGHHGGIISQMLIDPAGRFMVSASSNRGWSGESTRVVLIHDIKHLG